MTDDQNTDIQDIHELTGKSPEFRTQLAKQLEDLVPEVVADGKVDVLKLKELLQDDAGDTKERFGLFWPGKKRAMRAAQEPTTATLKPAKELSKDWDSTENIFIEGDNLEVLKVLQKQYHNAIKMIYIDPPYNTGKDFVYPDNFKEGLQNYLEFSKQVDAGGKKISTNAETQGRYHSNWLNMMYPRLKLARNLLTDDGVIFISIDDAEQPHLRKLCDEIFGEDNLIAQFIHKNNSSKNQAKLVSVSTEYIFAYARNKINLKNVQWRIVKKGAEDIVTFFNKLSRQDIALDEILDEIKLMYARPKYSHLSRWNKVDRKGVFMDADLSREGGSKDYTIVNPNTGKECLVPARGWGKSKDELLRLQEEGLIYYGDESTPPRMKQYIEADTTAVPDNFWYFDNSTDTRWIKDTFEGGLVFENPKPVRLIQQIIELNTGNDDIILDFFSGSGTTAHAVMQLNAEDGGNRKHIQVQLPEPTDEKSEAYKAGYYKISDIARERINRAGEKIKTDFADKLAERSTPLDVGYRTFKLSDTNFTKWKSEATNDLGELQLRLDAMRNSSDDNASEEDLLVEVMLKLGLPLTARTQPRDIDGLTVHQVVATGDDTDSTTQPVFYLNEHVKPTLEQLRAIVTELTPSRFVILDDAFQGDNQLKTNLVQTCKSYDVELWTV